MSHSLSLFSFARETHEMCTHVNTVISSEVQYMGHTLTCFFPHMSLNENAPHAEEIETLVRALDDFFIRSDFGGGRFSSYSTENAGS